MILLFLVCSWPSSSICICLYHIFIFLLDILFTFQMLSPFPVSPPETPYPIPTPPCSLTHPLPLPCPGIQIHPSQDQGRLFSLMSNKAIFCYICTWSHESLHGCSFVGGLVPGSSGITGWFILLFLLWDCKHFQLLGSFL